MSENSSINEKIGILFDAVFEFAQEFPHDERIFWVGFLGVLISGVAVVLSYLLNRNQSKFLKQQNKIALFEKRYEIYYEWRLLSVSAGICSSYLEGFDRSKLSNTETNKKMLIVTFLSKLLSFTDIKKYVEKAEDRLNSMAKHFDEIENIETTGRYYDILFFNFGTFAMINHLDYIPINATKDDLYLQAMDELILFVLRIDKISSIFPQCPYEKFKKIKIMIAELVNAHNFDSVDELFDYLDKIANEILFSNPDALLKDEMDII